MRTAYLDCIGGISGDMLLAALIHAGADPDRLRTGLATLGLPDWELRVESVRKAGIAARAVEVVVGGRAAGDASLLRLPPADSPLEADSGHTHSGEGGHTHTHGHEAGSGGHRARSGERAGLRTFAEVSACLRAGGLPETVRARAETVYRRLAEAEAAVHGQSLETVHFHEVGAVDSIVDVVGSVYALDLLGVERVVCSALPAGRGFIRCEHGLMPVPAPATMELLRGCPLRPVEIEAELVTPTGAALAASLAESFGPMPALTPGRIGYGAGRRELPFPNVVRVVIGDSPGEPAAAGEVWLLEANIDDQSPQLYDRLVSCLLDAGALDVWITPILMKKGRPAHTLSLLCEPQLRETMLERLFQESTTLGVRYSAWSRTCLEREWVEAATPFGTVRIKVGRRGGAVVNASPEYEDCRSLAEERGVPLKRVQAAAAAAAWEMLSAPGSTGPEPREGI